MWTRSQQARAHEAHYTARVKPTQLLDDDGTASMATMIMCSHHAFRRDLARFRAALSAYEPARLAALREEWKHYCEALHGHHQSEDVGIFPSARKDHPQFAAAIDHLSDQHHRIDPILARGHAAFEALPGTADALAIIEELHQLLDAHLDMEEAVLIPTLRGFKEFPALDEAVLDTYADGFAWALHGIAPEVVEKMRAMLAQPLLARIPAAIERFDARSERAWGHVTPTRSTTSCPES